MPVVVTSSSRKMVLPRLLLLETFVLMLVVNLHDGVLLFAQAQQEGSNTMMTWEPVASFPGDPRHHPIAFANATHGFVLTGTTVADTVTNDFHIYEEATDTWTSLPAPPLPARSFAYGVVLGQDIAAINSNKAYMGFGLGEASVYLQDFWEFDMQTLAWKQLASLTDGPGRRHPAMNAVPVFEDNNGQEVKWEIHVGLGDGLGGNYNDWHAYSIEDDTWRQLDNFPSSPRHHPFYFSLGASSYVGLGHSSAGIERDWFRYDAGTGWEQEESFASYDLDNPSVVITQEARVAGTQFSMQVPGASIPLGFVLSGDGDNHGTMATGEFHVYNPLTGRFSALPPHPGASRWAPDSFVMQGSSRVYFLAGYDRLTRILHNDVHRIDLAPLFQAGGIAGPQSSDEPTASPVGSETPAPASFALPKCCVRLALVVTVVLGFAW